jgi:hypothetical protein
MNSFMPIEELTRLADASVDMLFAEGALMFLTFHKMDALFA